MTMLKDKKPRELSGRTVLVSLICFFGVVFAVNIVMLRAATSTFGGVETTSSYKAGLNFKNDEAAAEKQSDLNWKVDGKIARDKSGEAVLDIAVVDASGKAVPGISAVARLAHPADERLDHVVPLHAAGDGKFHGVALAAAGQWELIIGINRGGERVFRSRSRVTLN